MAKGDTRPDTTERISRPLLQTDTDSAIDNHPEPLLAPANTITQQTIVGTPMPQLYDSPDMMCEEFRHCSPEELEREIAAIADIWGKLPEEYRKQCLSNQTVPAMFGCFLKQELNYYNLHPQATIKDAPWLAALASR